MTPEQAAERAAYSLDRADALNAFPEQAVALVAVADGWTRLHTALANAPKPDAATPDVHYELGIDKILRRNEELKRAAGLAVIPALAMPIDPEHPPIVRVASIDHKVIGWDFDRGIDGMGASLRLKLNRI